jgi:catechol 2,3-dioxygenase-like lactoylglutathione lyase family enzyme
VVSGRPSRLHHHAYVSRDQRATRRFYEGVIGLPLVATWCEVGDFGSGPEPYCHTFFELGEGGCLAFFQFASAETTERHAKRASTSPFDHVAIAATAEVQRRIEQRASAAGVAVQRIDHGYCESLYLRDPDGLIVEITVDDARALAEAAERRASADEDLERWLAGDHTPNNALRDHDIGATG